MCESGFGRRGVMMVADQFHGQGSGACLGGQVRAPLGMMFSHHERQAQPVRSPFRPALRGLPEKMFSQHNHDAVEDGQGQQDFPHIVQEGSRQQVRGGLPGSLQPFEYLVSMHLFRRLHPAEEDELGGGEMGKQGFARDMLAGAEQGIPELAGAVGKAGYHHGLIRQMRRWKDYNIVIES